MRKFLTFFSMLMLCSALCFSQTMEIKGKIIDEAGNPIPFASVKVKGKRTGVIANLDGDYQINATNGSSLVVSAQSMVSTEVSIEGKSVINVTLKLSGMLSDIVVTGVGTATSKKKLGISVESISADKLPPVPTASIDQALIGKIPGAQIQSVDGTPGARADIVLRGINTIQGGTKPLILLDGVEVFSTDVNSLDLSSIERVEVVQGAASATLYGAQGANGVIQLFSKKGRRGTASINFSSTYSVNQYLNIGDVHKATKHTYLTDANNNFIDASGDSVVLDENGIYQGVQFANSAGTFPSAQLNPANIYSKAYNKNLKYYDQLSQLFANAHSQNNNLNISGAGDRMDYSLFPTITRKALFVTTDMLTAPILQQT